MFSKGNCEVKNKILDSVSESNPPSIKRSCLPKIRPLNFCLVCIITYIIVIVPKVLEDWKYSKKPLNPKPIGPNYQDDTSDLPNLCYPKDEASPSKVCSIKVENSTLINVRHYNTYVVSSYMEHRFGTSEIRSVAIARRNELVTYYCMMCCEGGNIYSTQATYSFHSDHYNFDYGTADIMCSFSSVCSTPTHVAITDSDFVGSITSFQPIRNQVIPKSFHFNFTVCISVMFEYNQVLNLIQAMEMFKLLGVQRVAIYKTSCDSGTQKVLDYYVRTGFLELIPWTAKEHIKVSTGWQKDKSPGELHYYGQIPALNDCVYRYMYQSHYVALQDIDELILPLHVRTWTELLPELEKVYTTDVGFEFENNVFPVTGEAEMKYEQDTWKNTPGTNILKYIDRVPNDPNHFNNIKVIVNPRLVLEATVHGLLKTANERNTVRVRNDIARIYHTKSFKYPQNTQLIRDKRLWDYADDLITAVSNVLHDCGFITKE